MPKSAINAIAYRIYRMILAVSAEGSYHGDHLIMAQTFFDCELIVADTAVKLADTDDSVKYILSVIALIERQIVFFQFFGRG